MYKSFPNNYTRHVLGTYYIYKSFPNNYTRHVLGTYCMYKSFPNNYTRHVLGTYYIYKSFPNNYKVLQVKFIHTVRSQYTTGVIDGKGFKSKVYTYSTFPVHDGSN